MYRFVWHIKLDNPDDKQAFVDNWHNGSAIIQAYPGALGTHLHAVRDKPGEFFAVADWESQETRDAMQTDIDAGGSKRSQQWQQLPGAEKFGHITAFAGEEIETV